MIFLHTQKNLVMSTIIRIFPKVTAGTGGMENHIRQLTEEQRLLGMNLILIMNEGVKLHENDILIRPDIKLYNTNPQFIGFIRYYYYVCISILRLNLKADIIHIHGDWSSYMFAPLIRWITKANRTYFSFHGMMRDNFVHSKILPFIIKNFCDRIFVTGYESYLILSHTKKAIFQPSGVKSLFFRRIISEANDKFKIVTLTFLRPQKNVITFLNVAKLLPNLDFQIIGEGPEDARLKEYAKTNNLSNVEFLGNKSSEDVKKVLDKADIFLFTSKEEGTPTAVMEAMACGLPIVTSNAGGTESIVRDYENGFVVYGDYENPFIYLNMIKILINDPFILEKIRSNNYKKAELFKWDIVAKRVSFEMFN